MSDRKENSEEVEVMFFSWAILYVSALQNLF